MKTIVDVETLKIALKAVEEYICSDVGVERISDATVYGCCGTLAKFGHREGCVASKAQEALYQAIHQKHEPFDADDDKFREAFEHTVSALNVTIIRKGMGYRSPFTQFAWQAAFGVVNRLRLHKLNPKKDGHE